MINTRLDEFLRDETPSERWHKDHPGEASEVYRTLTTLESGASRVYMFDFTDYMSPEGIIIFKETRFTDLPPHVHTYLEMNYVYSGQCTFDINGKRGVLHEGDLCIMEPDVTHSAEFKDSDDIVLNIALKDSYYQHDLLTGIEGKDTISHFLLDSLSEKRRRDRFLVFRAADNLPLRWTINSLVYQYFFDRRAVGYYSRIRQYIRLLYMHLADMIFDADWSEYSSSRNHEIVMKAIRHISQNYATCRLTSLADALGYNYTYLSSLLRKETGRSFSELRLEQQLIAARELLLHSSLPISDICERTGFSNHSLFFRRFSAFSGTTPGQYRSQHRQD